MPITNLDGLVYPWAKSPDADKSTPFGVWVAAGSVLGAGADTNMEVLISMLGAGSLWRKYVCSIEHFDVKVTAAVTTNRISTEYNTGEMGPLLLSQVFLGAWPLISIGSTVETEQGRINRPGSGYIATKHTEAPTLKIIRVNEVGASMFVRAWGYYWLSGSYLNQPLRRP